MILNGSLPCLDTHTHTHTHTHTNTHTNTHTHKETETDKDKDTDTNRGTDRDRDTLMHARTHIPANFTLAHPDAVLGIDGDITNSGVSGVVGFYCAGTPAPLHHLTTCF